MANPQTKNGHTSIADELLDAIIAIRVSGEENQCLWLIIRKTYGWKKKEDWISLSQFQDKTGMAKPSIIRALNKLLDKNIIYKKVNGKGVSYGIQKNYKKWKPLTKKLTINKKATGVYKKVILDLQKSNSGFTKKLPTIETITRDTVTRDTITINMPDWLPKEEWHDFIAMRIEIKFPLTNRAAKAAINKLEKLKKEGSDPSDVLNNSVIGGYRGLFATKGRKNGQVSRTPKTSSEGLADKDYHEGTW